jgi:acyl dehydratase
MERNIIMAIAEEAFQAQLKQIGSEIGISPWVTVNQTMIDKFADVTMDPQFIHVDEERAKLETPFGGTIAHGFLSLSLASKFAIDTFPPQPGQLMGINYGLNKVRFLNPVKNGVRIRGRFTMNKVTKKSELQILRELGLTIEIENDLTPALYAEWLGLAIFG